MNCGPDPLELIPLDKLRYQVEVNLLAPVTVTQVPRQFLTDSSPTGSEHTYPSCLRRCVWDAHATA